MNSVLFVKRHPVLYEIKLGKFWIPCRRILLAKDNTLHFELKDGARGARKPGQWRWTVTTTFKMRA